MAKLMTMAFAAALTAATSSIAISAPMDNPKIQQSLEAQGYSNVQVTKREQSHADVTAMKNGKSERLEVDLQTGQIKPDDGDDD